MKTPEQQTKELDRLRARVAELEARILSDNKAYGCELRDPNGTIWEYAETLKKRVAELELQTFDIKELEADKAALIRLIKAGDIIPMSAEADRFFAALLTTP